MKARLAAIVMAAGAVVPQCTGVPSVTAGCQVYHHKAELRIINTDNKAIAHLESALITLANGRQQASSLGDYQLKPGDTYLGNVALTRPAGGHNCSVEVKIH